MTIQNEEVIVTIENITKAFGTNQVLNGVSMTVRKGEAVALIGPSGSGKSTLLRCINGLVQSDSGTIQAAGHAVHSLKGMLSALPCARTFAWCSSSTTYSLT